jgi:hypothetical protein
MAFFGLAMVGVLTAMWWPTWIFGLAAAVMWLGGLEIRILCSHCPFYADEGPVLKCQALAGSPKLWRYRPGPLSGLEKVVLLGMFTFLVLFPISVQAYGVWAAAARSLGTFAVVGMVGVTLGTTLAALQFTYILVHDFCSSCVNFACPLNRSPKTVVYAFLRKNPVELEAWEKAGYRLASADGDG